MNEVKGVSEVDNHHLLLQTGLSGTQSVIELNEHIHWNEKLSNIESFMRERK